MRKAQRLLRSRRLEADRSGRLVEITAARAGWRRVGFGVQQVRAGGRWRVTSPDQEVCLVLLSGHCRVRWAGESRWHELGPRATVFASYPHAVYAPPGIAIEVHAISRTELADCRAASDVSGFAPRIITPADCGFEIRGGGSATRQIVDILPPAFAADRLLICEVYTPSGNWSSYPPHKHDVDHPPVEAALEETYYFRMKDPDGYAFQRVYTADGRVDDTYKVEDGDLLLIHEGYHPFVTAFGYDAYYLNVLAGSRRSMAATDDPRYAGIRDAWPPPDPRVPVVPRPVPVAAVAGSRS
jgi:5-deoxy-glucuronate isomerase